MPSDFDTRPIHPILYESEFARMGWVPGTPVVLFQQASKSIPIAEFEARWNEIVASLDAVARSAHALMIDVRSARGRNDPEFEQLFAPYRARMSAGWRRVAIVVASPQGVLQVQRYAREDQVAVRIYDDPDLAFLWLQGV